MKGKKWVVWLSVLAILTCGHDEELWKLAPGDLGIFLVILGHEEGQIFYPR